MYAWGDSSLGHHFNHGQELLKPEKIDFDKTSIKAVAATDNRCCLLLSDGSVHIFGRRDDKFVGQGSSSTKVSALETLNIVDVFAGGNHIFVISDKGHVYGWGSNDKGQLGWRDETNSVVVSVPKCLKFLQSKKVVQISCGKTHSLMLIQDGSIYSLGENTYGQLGIGSFSEISQPVEITSLRGLPIIQVASGGWHSFCVTFSGKVFCWGRNDCGQLGLGNRSDRSNPHLLKMPRSQLDDGVSAELVMYVAAGDIHTAVLTKGGGVSTFGSSSKGQLGHGSSTESEVNPRKVFELMGSVVTQIACGNYHTVAYVPDSCNVFAWGCGEHGQLGLGQKVEFLATPTIVKGPWCYTHSEDPENAKSSQNPLKLIEASGNQTIAIMCSNKDEQSFDFRVIPHHRRNLTLDADFCARFAQFTEDSIIPEDVVEHLECIFSSQSCLNGCFLANDHHLTSNKYCGLNLTEARIQFSKLCQGKNKKILQTITDALTKKLFQSLTPEPPNVEALRLYLTLPELELFHDPQFHDSLVLKFVESLLKLSRNSSRVLDNWYRKLESNEFDTPIKICQKYIISFVQSELKPDERENLLQILKFLDKLNKINNSSHPVTDYRKFYIPELNQLLTNVKRQDFFSWEECFDIGGGTDFSFCRYPFVLDSVAKMKLLYTEAVRGFASHFDSFVCDLQMMAIMPWLGQGPVESPVIEVVIRRDKLIEDAVQKIPTSGNLKKPFRIKFAGEEGQDYGAVRKEFFMLFLEKILSSDFDIFKEYKDSSLLWFSNGNSPFATDRMYQLVGTICGLAIYNSTIIDLNFPLAMYKKLLGMDPDFNDLKELDPTVGNSLQQLLDFVEEDGDTVADIFELSFSATFQVQGESTEVNLKENGDHIKVTADNRSEYVTAYVNYVFNESVTSSLSAFREGFYKVCGGKVLELFRPEELREMVVGNQNYDWKELEKATIYKDPYCPKHQMIIWFWEVFHSFTSKEKEDFLVFLTGCKKIPIDGLKMAICPLDAENDEFLPVSHACFNTLDLPRYPSKEKMEEKLKLALKCKYGFHKL